MKKAVKAGIAAGAALCLGAGLMELYRFTFYRRRSALSEALFSGHNHSEDYYLCRDAAKDALNSMVHEVFTLKSDNGYKLNGFYYRSGAQRSDRVAYIVHGYRSEHSETAGFFADYYLSRGIDIFCDDHVASGASGGLFVGWDYLESKDCLKWIKLLKKLCGDDVKIILHGFSMGGATVLGMSDRCPENVRFIVSDSGYTSAPDVIGLGKGIFKRPLVALLNRMNRRIAGYDLKDTDVRAATAATGKPVLFVHGDRDGTVPLGMGLELFELCSSPDKDMLIVDDARHVESYYCAPEAYEEKLDRYVNKYFN